MFDGHVLLAGCSAASFVVVNRLAGSGNVVLLKMPKWRGAGIQLR